MKINDEEKHKKWLSLTAIFYVLFFSPFIIFAQIEITEIMYDLAEGSDGGREWVEIHNMATEEINLLGWKFFEAKTNHKIESLPEGGSVLLPSGAYALIVDNFEKFKIDYPNFSSLVFDSAFSLSNTGEAFVIRNADLIDIDTVSYLSDWGANGDGNSLQKINGVWLASAPTPGEANYLSSQPENGGEENDSEEDSPEEPQSEIQSQTTPSSVVTPYKIKPQIFGTIILPQDKPITGADFLFEGISCGLKNEPLENEKYQWTFGDGGKAQGQKVLYAYQYPGEYMVVLQVISGKYVGSDRLKINVLPSNITISNVEFSLPNKQFIELHNPSSYELNLSWWRLKVDNNYFTFPRDTIILPKKYLKLSSKTTGLFSNQTNQISLLYPNGSVAFVYKKKEETTQNIPLQEKIVILPTNQVASIQKITEPEDYSSEKVEEDTEKIVSNEDWEIQDISSSQNLQEQPLKLKSKKPLFNKWTVLLVGVVLLAVAGIVLASKLDQ